MAAASASAADALAELLESTDETIRPRAASELLAFTFRRLELAELEDRLAELEANYAKERDSYPY